jgi:hypothetical protein
MVLELGGRSNLPWFSVAYERQLSEVFDVSIGLGASLGIIIPFQMISIFAGTEFTAINLKQKTRGHSVVLPAGFSFSRSEVIVLSEGSYFENRGGAYLGVVYEYRNEYVVRVGPYIHVLLGKSRIGGELIEGWPFDPWFGLTIGRTFSSLGTKVVGD